MEDEEEAERENLWRKTPRKRKSGGEDDEGDADGRDGRNWSRGESQSRGDWRYEGEGEAVNVWRWSKPFSKGNRRFSDRRLAKKQKLNAKEGISVTTNNKLRK